MAVLKLVIFTVTAGFGWAIIAYEGYASPRGWPVGAWLAGSFSWLQGLAYVALVGAVAASAYVGAWWHAVVAIVGAILLVRLLFYLAGPQSQVVSLFGVVVGVGLSAVMGFL